MRYVTALLLAAVAVLAVAAAVSHFGTGSQTGTVASSGTSWYVRPDGGSPEQCTGLVDSPYPGNGTSQPCAWDHPFHALPPEGTPRIAGGDTLIVGNGAYMIGYGAPGADNCESDYSWDCYMAPVPGGPGPGQPTRIVGAGWEADCANPPEFWGTERSGIILNLTGSSNVEVACLEITDHSGCVEFHSGSLACERESFPYGPWAGVGIYAEDSQNVFLHDLNIHGLGDRGVLAGRLTDWTVEDVRIAGNGWAGWDGDIDGDDSNAGTLSFRRWTVEWNGCGETWPGGQPSGCWAQTAGGYGDGVGTGTTGGHWIIEDSAFLHNTSDGLDLLYVSAPGSLIEIRQTIAEGNAGNQIKTAGAATIENTIAVGNCGYFDGQPFTFNVDNCRAGGNTLSLYLNSGELAGVANSTLTGEGDCLVIIDATANPDGSETALFRNNIFQGQTDFEQPFENSCLAWAEGFSHNPFDIDYSLIAGVKDDACPGAHDICGVSPGLADSSVDSFDAHLLPGSPAIDAGTSAGVPSDDFDGHLRDSQPDIGAYEYGAAGTEEPTSSGAPPASSPTVTPTATPTPSQPTPAGSEVWGDTNCSGSVDPVDSLLTLRFDAGLSTNTGDCPDLGQVVDVQNASLHLWGDVDCGGQVTPVDSLKTLRYDAGLSVSQEQGCPEIGSEVLIVEETNTPTAAVSPQGDTLTVNVTDDTDDGACGASHCSLREAIAEASDGDTIAFNIPPTDPGYNATLGVWTIKPMATVYVSAGVAVDGDTQTVSRGDTNPLGPEVELDGSNQSTGHADCFGLSGRNVLRGFVINRCGRVGVFVTGFGSVVAGNYIGVDATGTQPRTYANDNFSREGVNVSGDGNRIGGAAPADRNVISGNNGVGIHMFYETAHDNQVVGNYIGTNRTGNSALGNKGAGVTFTDGAHDNTVGGGNVIAFNGWAGVAIAGSSPPSGPIPLRNAITQNSIHSNSGPGIYHYAGGNLELAAPVVTSAAGPVMGTACAGCLIEVFSDAGDEGATYEGYTTADGSGNWSVGLTPQGPYVTATATDSVGNTSQFSTPIAPA
jgi:CSLREA domain-containing protein